MSRFFSEQPNPLNVVEGTCRLYDVPDIAACDKWLADLCFRIHSAPNIPNLIAQYRADSDLLLDRRLWLEMLPRTEKT